MYTTLMFDLSEVLISGLLGVEKTLGSRLALSEKTILKFLGGKALKDLCLGIFSEDTYIQNVLGTSGWRISPGMLKEIIRHNFRHVIPGMPELLRDLSANYYLVLHSDHAREWIDYIHRIHSFLRLFSVQLFSFELGKTKSDPAVFSDTLSRIHRNAAECLFIDDNSDNTHAASLAGIQTVQFVSANDLISTLRRMGIKCGNGIVRNRD